MSTPEKKRKLYDGGKAFMLILIHAFGIVALGFMLGALDREAALGVKLGWGCIAFWCLTNCALTMGHERDLHFMKQDLEALRSSTATEGPSATTAS